jgi:XTP/dITP diphosphohydrolase
MKVVLATTNKGKIAEIQSLAQGIEFIGLDGLEVVMPEETGLTMDENAIIKSESVFAQTGIPTLAEDSGLCVDYLGGQPGVHSARFAGDSRQNMDKLLSLLGDSQERDAHFETVFSFTDSSGTCTFKGFQHGTIGFEPIGNGGFGYDPIFVNELGKTNAQLTVEEKNSMSARGKALRSFLDWFSVISV